MYIFIYSFFADGLSIFFNKKIYVWVCPPSFHTPTTTPTPHKHNHQVLKPKPAATRIEEQMQGINPFVKTRPLALLLPDDGRCAFVLRVYVYTLI